jgi:hypothetical protein
MDRASGGSEADARRSADDPTTLSVTLIHCSRLSMRRESPRKGQKPMAAYNRERLADRTSSLSARRGAAASMPPRRSLFAPLRLRPCLTDSGGRPDASDGLHEPIWARRSLAMPAVRGAPFGGNSGLAQRIPPRTHNGAAPSATAPTYNKLRRRGKASATIVAVDE